MVKTAQKNNDARKRLLAALFVKAQNRGIDADELREDIAPVVIGKRISEASAREIVELLDHVTKLYKGAIALPFPSGDEKRAKHYDSSRAGLIEEMEDAARERWGVFEKKLNSFVNSHRPVHTHYKFLSVAELKAFKERLKEMNGQDNGNV